MVQADQILERFQITLYELLATLLPGSVLTYAAITLTPLPRVAGTLQFIVAAFIAGVAIQGLAGSVFEYRRLKRWLGISDAPQHNPWAMDLLAEELRQVLPDREGFPQGNAPFNICLSRIGGDRFVHDKFVALRDMARGLALTGVVAALLLVLHEAGGSTPRSVLPLQIVGTALGVIGFLLRFKRFAPIVRPVVDSQYIALRLAERARSEKTEERASDLRDPGQE